LKTAYEPIEEPNDPSPRRLGHVSAAYKNKHFHQKFVNHHQSTTTTTHQFKSIYTSHFVGIEAKKHARHFKKSFFPKLAF